MAEPSAPVRAALLLGSAVAVGASLLGPLAEQAHADLAAHMVGHVLLGMLAPLLLVAAAPVRLLFAVLPRPAGRRLGRVLRARVVRWLTEPAVAAVLDVGGLWLLYAGGLYAASHHRPVLHALVHLHVVASGILFTAVIVGPDPLPHRRSHRHRAVVLVAAVAAHDILAKYLYAHPPAGVASNRAELAAQVMYYGGDAVSLVIMVMLCLSWLHWRSETAGRGAGTRSDERRTHVPRRATRPAS